MEKMRMESVDMTAQNIKKIAELFPNCITETKNEDGKLQRAVNFDMLRQMLSGEVVEGDEAYEFTWVGKKASIVEANRPIRKTLRPSVQESVNWDSTENLYIVGDNLEAIKLLQESYLGRIKLIYIDPPYNTGGDFIYNDNFAASKKDYDADSGVYGDEGEKLFKNTDTNGRFHSDWCSMIYSRLLLARNLLTEDGCIFISIDDNEVENLTKICDEIFGRENRLAILVWKKKYTGGKGTSTFADYHEYILSYAKKVSALGEISMARPDEEKGKFVLEDEYVKERGRYYTRPLKSNLDPRPTLVYPIELPDGGTVTTQWICAKDTYFQLLREGRIEFKDSKSSKYPVYKKFYEKDGGGNVKIPSFIEVSNNNEAKEELKTLFDIVQTRDLPFQTPKPTKLLELFVENLSGEDDIVMDFFAGSSSTAHATMNVNARDGKRRKFIMIQADEGNDLRGSEFSSIAEFGMERIRRAGKAIQKQAGILTKDLDIGFRAFRLDESNMNDVYYSAGEYHQDMLSLLETNIKEDRTDLDLLFGCLLEWGLPISLPYSSEDIEGFTVHTYNDGDLIACFDEDIPDSVIKTIAKRQPLRAVFRDSSFSTSPAKINVGEIFKMLAPDTSVKII